MHFLCRLDYRQVRQLSWRTDADWQLLLFQCLCLQIQLRYKQQWHSAPAQSVNVYVTDVVPTGNVAPGLWVELTMATSPQLVIAVGAVQVAVCK